MSKILSLMMRGGKIILESISDIMTFQAQVYKFTSLSKTFQAQNLLVLGLGSFYILHAVSAK